MRTAKRLVVSGAALAVLSLSAAPALAASTSPSPSPKPSGSASAGSGSATAGASVVTFGIGPSTKQQVDRRPNYNMLSPRGGVVKDELAVVNLTYQPLTLNLYAADGLNSADGSFTLQPGYVAPKDTAKWVTFGGRGAKGFIVLQPREKAYVPFTVHIPKDAFVGDHLGGIVASLVSQGSTPGDRNTNIKLEQRVGIRLGVRVAGVLTPKMEISDVTASYAGTVNPFGKGTATITYKIKNTGNVRLGGQQEVTVHGLVGPTASAGQLADIPLLLPGNTAQVSVTVPDVSPFFYEAADVTVNGLGAAGDADPPVEVATASTNFWAIPWTALAALLTAAAVAAGVVRSRRGPGQASGPAPSAANASNLVSASSSSSESV